MIENPCVIDDEECGAVLQYAVDQGDRLDQMVSAYVSRLQAVKNSAIIKGTAHDSLEVFLGYAEKLQNQIGNISKDVRAQVLDFQTRVSEADQYSF